MSKRGSAVIAAAALSFVTLVLAVSRAQAGGDDLAPTKAMYDAKCARCHGPDGSGNTKAGQKLKVRDLRSAEAQKLSDAEMKKVITNGKEKMPEFKTKLSEVEIESLVKFVRTLKAH